MRYVTEKDPCSSATPILNKSSARHSSWTWWKSCKICFPWRHHLVSLWRLILFSKLWNSNQPEIQNPVGRGGECKVKVTNLSPNLRNVAPPQLHEIERREGTPDQIFRLWKRCWDRWKSGAENSRDRRWICRQVQKKYHAPPIDSGFCLHHNSVAAECFRALFSDVIDPPTVRSSWKAATLSVFHTAVFPRKISPKVRE